MAILLQLIKLTKWNLPLSGAVVVYRAVLLSLWQTALAALQWRTAPASRERQEVSLPRTPRTEHHAEHSQMQRRKCCVLDDASAVLRSSCELRTHRLRTPVRHYVHPVELSPSPAAPMTDGSVPCECCKSASIHFSCRISQLHDRLPSLRYRMAPAWRTASQHPII